MFVAGIFRLSNSHKVDTIILSFVDYRLMNLIKRIFGKSLEEKLREAIENNDFSGVQSLISQGVNINCIYENNMTPLHFASIMGEMKIIELLINNGANVKATTKNGYNALMTACIRNDLELVELLLKYNSDVNQRSKNGWTSLLLASGNVSSNSIYFQNNRMGLEIFQVLDKQKLYTLKNEPIKIVRLLIDAGSNVNQKNNFNNPSLNEAVFSANFEVVKSLLENGANVEDKTDFGDTPLIFVSNYTYGKYRESIVNLLDRIWDITGDRDDKNEFRPKIKGALLNDFKNSPNSKQVELFNSQMIQIADLLVHHGASVKTKNSAGASAIIAAAGQGNIRILEFLIKSGGDPNDQYDTDMSALFLAAQNGNSEVIKTLLKNGANIESPLNDGETALMTAVWFGNVDVVKILVAKGANVNAKKITPQNKNGESPLSWAAYKFKNERDPRYGEIFEILHNAGAR
jgi:ankyrin repeat protein